MFTRKYRCLDCGKKFTLFIEEVRSNKADGNCPRCGGYELEPAISFWDRLREFLILYNYT